MEANPPLPPHSIEAEQALLGAILNSVNALDAVDGIVTSADFFEPFHVVLFESFIAARAEGKSTLWQVANAALPKMMKDADLGGMTGQQYLARLASEATTVVNARDFARIIAENADRRRLIQTAGIITHQADGGVTAPATLAIDAMGELDAIAARFAGAHTASLTLADASARSIERMQDAMTRGGGITGVSTGLADLDRKLSGWQRGDYILLAGRPGMGKSGLLISSLRQSAKLGANGLMFSLEMSAESITDRMLSDECYRTRDPISYSDIARGTVTNSQAEAVIEAKRLLDRLSVKIDPQAGLSIQQIAARARRYRQQLERLGKTLDLVAIDHMHIVKASSRYAGNRVGEITEISGAIKPLAKELNCPVVVLAQLSRGVETRDDKRPMLSDLRDSGSLEQDADTIIFLYREAYYLQSPLADEAKDMTRLSRLAEVEHKLEAFVAKQRNGPVGLVDLFFDPASNAARGISLVEMERAAA